MAYTTYKFRNKNRVVFSNSEELYNEILSKRDITNLRQYATIELPDLRRIREIKSFNHVWKTGDRYFKLANQYYGRPELWWIIARYNGAPTEASLKRGDVVLIPTPIETILHYL
tara:strand:- start:150 stop:491 length:342 start_codon:yes stop_codon:yes gene_type:complete